MFKNLSPLNKEVKMIFLQIWGGIFFLLNKVFLSLAERTEKKKQTHQVNWRKRSWVVFLIGVPAWIVIFVIDRNWIAAALEAGGVPSMFIGLSLSRKSESKEPSWLRYVALGAIVLGLGYSLYDFGGFNTYTQVWELLMTTGFLVGTYQIAKKKLSGYVWYILMHVACIALMYLGQHPWLLVQQIISILFVVDAYYTKKKH